MQIHSVCVYCGSSPGLVPEYNEATNSFGRLLAREKLTLVYGGGDVGLMGTIADAALNEGGRVIGVIPRGLVAKEVAHQGLSELREVETMHDRKQLMADLADAFVALPGGLGTLEEILEVQTWSQLSLHQKPCALLNTNGFFNHLLRQLAYMVEQRFLKQEHFGSLIVESEGAVLLQRMRSYTAVTVDKWRD